jgi:hypothetical protein
MDSIEALAAYLLLQLSLNLANQLFSPTVDLILCIDEGMVSRSTLSGRYCFVSSCAKNLEW